jgi:hypothetical protein
MVSFSRAEVRDVRRSKTNTSGDQAHGGNFDESRLLLA